MKKMVVAAGLTLAVVVMTGCQSTRVAGTKRSQEEQNWEQMIRRNYPGYRAPRAAAQAHFDNTEDRVSHVAPAVKPEAAADPETAPQALPEVQKNAAPANDVQEAPKADAVKADMPEAPKADAVKADMPEAPKADAGQADAPEAPKADTAKADTPALTQPVAPPDPTSGTVYVVKPGDTLGKIAQKHYGKAAYSNLIFKANSDILKNPNQLRPGMKLIVPKL